MTAKEFYKKRLRKKGFCIKIKHVHQLQNLYYCLTNTELKIIDQKF